MKQEKIKLDAFEVWSRQRSSSGRADAQQGVTDAGSKPAAVSEARIQTPDVKAVCVPLPDLPEPKGWLQVDDWTPAGMGYTADQMVAYALQYVLAHKAARRVLMPDDIHRIDWLESTLRRYGDGHTEPREVVIGWIGWQQTSEQPDFPGLRAAIDAAMKHDSPADTGS